MGRRTTPLACVAVVLLGALMPSVARPATGSRTAMAALESGVLTELNDIRAANGLQALQVNSELSSAARQHNSEMLLDGYFEHESVNGSPFWKRVAKFYGSTSYGRWHVGENLLWSSPSISPKRALAAWMESPGHRANILAADWREIGISAIHSDSSTGAFGGGAVTVITIDFGVRR